MTFLTSLPNAVVNLNPPGRYLHWSIFTVSLANLVLIAVMVVIFGLALLLPYPNRHNGDEDVRAAGSAKGTMPQPSLGTSNATTTDTATSDAATAHMWTARIRWRALAALPPDKLMPDRQPAYVASWIYSFGVASIVTLGIAIASGFAIALGGVDWWHTNPVGHFFNSLHLWSVELFMAFIVIHLWGKFWMAAWRGRRKLTWITGVVAFAASIIECFTGYLSQQNFDSQWISTNGKDAFNAIGIGAFFDIMNFGQMLLWHVVLVPIVLMAIVGAHVLLVRMRGVTHPLPVRAVRGRAARRAVAAADAADWSGPTRRYDIVKEGAAALLIALVLVVVLAVVLSSPDVPPVTVASWAKVAPADFMATAASELAGTSETATYGPPYNNANWVRPNPRAALAGAGGNPPADQRRRNLRALPALQTCPDGPARRPIAANLRRRSGETALTLGPGLPDGGDARPLRFRLARRAEGERRPGADVGLERADDGSFRRPATPDLLAQHPFYGTDFTKPLLFLEDGSYFSTLAQADHLTGSQWGVMNETGSYPGQPWLWLYTLWYQLPGFRSSANVDLIAVYLTGLATILLLAVPFLPGLRDIPRWIPLHRLVWRTWNQREAGGGPGSAAELLGAPTPSGAQSNAPPT